MVYHLNFDVPFSGVPQILVGKTCFQLGDKLSDQFGFDECRLDYDILYIVLTLALRKQGDPNAWIGADELGVLARGGASGSSTAKRLELALSAELRSGNGPRLIDFWRSQPEGAFRGGRSRGPYRLGRNIDVSNFDAATSLTILTGATGPKKLHHEEKDYTALVKGARLSHSDGEYVLAKTTVNEAIRVLYRGPLTFSGRDQIFALAESYALLANIDLELGRSMEGLHAARTAQMLFSRLRHPVGLGYALQVESHLYGQFEDRESAARSVAAARRALLQLDNGPRSHRKGISRSVYSGTLGWRLAMAGKLAPAARRLHSALRIAQNSDSESWIGIWSFRVAQNEILRGNLACAEKHLGLALDLQGFMSVSATAALARAATEFYLAIGDPGGARHWLRRAQAIGQSRSMKHQKRLVAGLAERLSIY